MSARFIETPHLPQGKVGLCALGEKYRENLEKPLQNLGITPFWLPENRTVDPRLSSHADLVLLHLGGNRVLTYLDRLPDIGLDAVKVTGQGREYPADARLCACVVGRFCIHNFRISEAGVAGFERVDVRQGYAKCCTCVVDAHSVITSDAGIARAAARHGLDVLRIRPGYVDLPGFDTGFIGGAAFKSAPDVLAFTGRLDHHPDWPEIEHFLRGRGVEPLFLTDMPAFDIGSAVPLTEAAGKSCP